MKLFLLLILFIYIFNIFKKKYLNKGDNRSNVIDVDFEEIE